MRRESNGYWLTSKWLMIVVCGGWAAASLAGELTVDGNLTVKTNLSVQGQLTSGTLSLTNVTVAGQAIIQSAVIQNIPPQGDLSMGPYTNRATGGN